MNDDGNRWRPWRDRPLVFGAPTIGAAERDEVIACLESGWLGTGPRVAELERLGQREGDAYVVRAQRLRERLWEVDASPL